MDILGSQAGKQEKEAPLREAMVREESERDFVKNLSTGGGDFAKSRISHESRNAESTCSASPLSACQNQNVQNFVLSQNPNISMNFSGQRHCLASGMCKICAINIFRNI